jgi:hypothetical protein
MRMVANQHIHAVQNVMKKPLERPVTIEPMKAVRTVLKNLSCGESVHESVYSVFVGLKLMGFPFSVVTVVDDVEGKLIFRKYMRAF